MGLLDRLRGKKETAAPPLDASGMIECFDASGRKLRMPKETWRANVLPSLRARWDDPAQLSALLVMSLKDGLHADLLEAAERLYAIDGDAARGASVYANVLLRNGRIDEAEGILKKHTDWYGEDAMIVAALANVHFDRGDSAKFEALLWHSIELDPNRDNSLNAYAAMAYERGGMAGQRAAWQRIAALPGSWRAQVWLARAALESKDSGRALAVYRESLSVIGDEVPAEALMQISGDLGRHGLLREAVDLCQPLFVPDRHGLQVGNNLIKANLELGRVSEARRILNQLRFLRRPDWVATLDFWDREMAKAC